MNRNNSIAKIRAAHPFPWVETVMPHGRVIVRDARGKEVSLLDITMAVAIWTHTIVKAEAEKAAGNAA